MLQFIQQVLCFCHTYSESLVLLSAGRPLQYIPIESVASCHFMTGMPLSRPAPQSSRGQRSLVRVKSIAADSSSQTKRMAAAWTPCQFTGT